MTTRRQLFALSGAALAATALAGHAQEAGASRPGARTTQIATPRCMSTMPAPASWSIRCCRTAMPGRALKDR